jgi:dTDP-4-dehydrorhamnose 3,5-epimerase
MPQHELALAWNDPDIGIRWPLDNPQLSPKDARGPRLKDLPKDRLFA